MSARDPRFRVMAAVLAQGSTVHLATSVCTLGVWWFAPEAVWLCVGAGGVWAAETWFAWRVGLDAALFEVLGEGLELNELDRGLVELGLVKHRASRPTSVRIEGAMRLWKRQLALAIGQGGLVAVAIALGAWS